MLSYKTKSTSRKFYNKWMYKIGLKIEGCAILRGRSIHTVKAVFGQDMDDKVFYPQWRTKSFVNRNSIIRFSEFMEKFPTDNYALRNKLGEEKKTRTAIEHALKHTMQKLEQAQHQLGIANGETN